MEVKVCVGSACYVKGSHDVIEGFQRLIQLYHLENQVVLKATFCLGHCTEAVSVEIDDQVYSVDKEHIEGFFKEKIYGGLKTCK